MQRLKDLGSDPSNPTFARSSSQGAEQADIDHVLETAVDKKPRIVMTKEGVTRRITMEEMKEHGATEECPWFVVDGEVYDGTGFLKDHPGGSESITLVAGEDASDDFMAIHSVDAKLRLAEFHIGTLDQTASKVDALDETSERVQPDPTFLSKTKWKSAQLVSVDRINHDSRIYRFALEDPEQPLGLPTGQHVYARLKRKPTAGGNPEEGETIQRAYTPVSLSTAKGFLDLLIKVYFKTPEFPEGGKMSMGFEELEIGDRVDFKGPLGSFEWLGGGVARWKGVQRTPKELGLICGGSGITPILQVLRGVLHDPTDTTTRLHLLNANKTEADILLRTELESFLASTAARYRHHLILSQADERWQFSRGRISRELLQTHLPPLDPDNLILICGPKPMIDMVKVELTELGWDVPNQLVVF